MFAQSRLLVQVLRFLALKQREMCDFGESGVHEIKDQCSGAPPSFKALWSTRHSSGHSHQDLSGVVATWPVVSHSKHHGDFPGCCCL